MLQLSGVLEIQSCRLKRDALKLMNAVVSGSAASTMWSVLENYFGMEEDIEEKEMEEAQSLAEMLKIQRGDKEPVPSITKEQADKEETEAAAKDATVEDDDEMESIASLAGSSAVGVGAKKKTLTELKKKVLDDYPEICSLKEAKIFYPTSALSMQATGVDSSLIMSRQKLPGYKGYYECNTPGCDYVAHIHGMCTSHVRRCHLGYALGCRFCPAKRWWQARYWSDHMDRYHKEHPKFEALELPSGVIKAEEIDPEIFVEKEKFLIPAPGAHPPPEPKRPRTEEQKPSIAEGADAVLTEPPVGSAIESYHPFMSTDLEAAMESQSSQEELWTMNISSTPRTFEHFQVLV